MVKKLLITLAGILCLPVLFAQNPVKWNFDAKKTGDKIFELHLTAVVSQPWHIYSQLTPEGGPLPTEISFNKNPLVSLRGVSVEKGKLVQKHEEVFGVDVKYFDGNVSFVQTVELRSGVKTRVSGKIKFMTCNDVQCLPPAEIPFSISLN